MKVIKIIFGIIVGFSALSTLGNALNEERGAGLFGALIVVILGGGLAFWLIWSAFKDKEKS
jgi:hypothetical protein